MLSCKGVTVKHFAFKNISFFTFHRDTMAIRQYLISTRIHGDPTRISSNSCTPMHERTIYKDLHQKRTRFVGCRSGCDILPYNRCAVTLSRNPREIRVVHVLGRHSLACCWEPSITRSLDLARPRARSSRTSIDRPENYMRSCPQTRRFGETGWTIWTISRWHPGRHGHKDRIFSTIVGSFRGIVTRYSR